MIDKENAGNITYVAFFLGKKITYLSQVLNGLQYYSAYSNVSQLSCRNSWNWAYRNQYNVSNYCVKQYKSTQ